MRGEAGFSLLEATIAAALTVAVAGSVFAMLQASQGTPTAAPETADMQQRLRVAVDALTRDLTPAGGGAYIGDPAGPLIQSFAPVLPFRQGLSADDPPGVIRADTVTIVSVPATAAQTTLTAALAPGAVTLQASPGAVCPAGTNLCGFAAGMTIAVYDADGAFDTFVLASIDDAASQLTLDACPAPGSATAYRAGSRVVQVRIDTYSLKSDVATQTFQLMHADGSANGDVPAVDHVVGLTFDYTGEPRPPALVALGRASYGPAPPAPGTQTTAYPPGENCLFRIDGTSGLQVPRLTASSAGRALVPLTAAQLADGPWCPDQANANRWDADLLRIRTVGVTVRVEAALAALRGPAGALFANAGSSRAANRWVPDQEIRVEVSPRNMNLGGR